MMKKYFVKLQGCNYLITTKIFRSHFRLDMTELCTSLKRTETHHNVSVYKPT